MLFWMKNAVQCKRSGDFIRVDETNNIANINVVLYSQHFGTISNHPYDIQAQLTLCLSLSLFLRPCVISQRLPRCPCAPLALSLIAYRYTQPAIQTISESNTRRRMSQHPVSNWLSKQQMLPCIVHKLAVVRQKAEHSHRNRRNFLVHRWKIVERVVLYILWANHIQPIFVKL